MNISEDSLIVTRDRTRSIKQCRDSLPPIHMDLVIEIFSRLPAKSVARYRCLSKFWDLLFRSQYFVDLFAANSSFRPQILFASRNESDYSFFSSAHQPSEKSCDDISPTQLKNFPASGSNLYDIGLPINGLVCLNKHIGDKWSVQVIYNPSTGEFLNLPEVKTRWTDEPLVTPFLGYDPTEKQFKVLSIVYNDTPWQLQEGELNLFMEYQVLTLETKKLSWRVIECCKPHCVICPQSRICINGVLYYRALDESTVDVIVCFDVRSETFRFIKVMETFNKNLSWASHFTNCNGKLGLLIPEKSDYHFMSRESVSFELRVLKDAQKHEWSKHVYVLPPAWMNVIGETKVRFVGMIGTNEIVLSSYYKGDELCVPFYIFYYNTEKKTIRRLTVQGLEASRLEQFYIFLNHVENVSSFKLAS